MKEKLAFPVRRLMSIGAGEPGISFAVRAVKKEAAAFRKLAVKFTSPTTKKDRGTYVVFKDPDGREFCLIEE